MIRSHQMPVVLAVVNFLFDNLAEKRSVPLTRHVLHVLKILTARQLKITAIAGDLYHQCLEQCLAHNRCEINFYFVNND